ncbi:hypothetical protein L873DRAFT_1813070, partial [Choiromyces venosus 120613-1]
MSCFLTSLNGLPVLYGTPKPTKTNPPPKKTLINTEDLEKSLEYLTSIPIPSFGFVVLCYLWNHLGKERS